MSIGLTIQKSVCMVEADAAVLEYVALCPRRVHESKSLSRMQNASRSHFVACDIYHKIGNTDGFVGEEQCLPRHLVRLDPPDDPCANLSQTCTCGALLFSPYNSLLRTSM